MNNRQLAFLLKQYRGQLQTILDELEPQCVEAGMEQLKALKGFDGNYTAEKFLSGDYEQVDTGHIIALDPLRDFIDDLSSGIDFLIESEI